MEFSKYLKKIRVESGLSQSEVATKLGYSTSQFVSNWERGLSHPPVQSVKVLADLYKVESADVFEALLRATLLSVETDLRKKFASVK